MNALAIHLYLTILYINLSFNYFGNFYRIIDRETVCLLFVYARCASDAPVDGMTGAFFIAVAMRCMVA